MSSLLLFWVAVSCSIFCGTLCRKKPNAENGAPPPPPPPAPRPPPPPPPTPTSGGSSGKSANLTASLLPTPQNIPPPNLKPIPLQPNQCAFGADSTDTVDSADGYAEANLLYLLVNDPAECSGIIESIEICFYITEATKYSYILQFLSFRLQTSPEAYRKVSAVSADVEISFVDTEGGEEICQIVELEHTLGLNEGDFLGFVTEHGFNIAFISSNDNKGIFQYIPSNDGTSSEHKKVDVSNVQSIPTTQLKQANTTATPALKIVMNTTETSSRGFPTPTLTPPDHESCNGDDSSSKRTVSLYTFAAAMIASAITIVALVVVVLIMCCCLCGCCVCCGGCCDSKVCKVCKSFCCQKKGKRAQKVGEIPLGQSMQYNDLYLPTDPEQVITGGVNQMTMLHKNPAYGQQTTCQSSSDKRGLDHTYETVEFSRGVL